MGGAPPPGGAAVGRSHAGPLREQYVGALACPVARRRFDPAVWGTASVTGAPSGTGFTGLLKSNAFAAFSRQLDHRMGGSKAAVWRSAGTSFTAIASTKRLCRVEGRRLDRRMGWLRH